ncbi:uncharacterized protein LOC106129543 [Amyelois transitella]|uniref:uncharacterized protein LOC106129543 n=1 Tax=Amyelois transitella TaxID=680683 RepID=UPI00067BB2D3|nr:uncharacterized protein LOC106129543 [Amyelois transitella]
MSDVRQFCYDDETGEVMTYHINDETGEPLVENLRSIQSRARTYRVRPRFSRISRPPKPVRFPKFHMAKTKQFQHLKENILAGSNTFSHRILLIPTVVFFPAVATILLMILEIYLHVRCHKKNKKLKDSTMYYRSPFHVVTRTFCGVCRDCDAASKVGQLQDERRHRYDYFRSLAI